jgi:hypothetical protein
MNYSLTDDNKEMWKTLKGSNPFVTKLVSTGKCDILNLTGSTINFPMFCSHFMKIRDVCDKLSNQNSSLTNKEHEEFMKSVNYMIDKKNELEIPKYFKEQSGFSTANAWKQFTVFLQNLSLVTNSFVFASDKYDGKLIKDILEDTKSIFELEYFKDKKIYFRDDSLISLKKNPKIYDKFLNMTKNIPCNTLIGEESNVKNLRKYYDDYKKKIDEVEDTYIDILKQVLINGNILLNLKSNVSNIGSSGYLIPNDVSKYLFKIKDCMKQDDMNNFNRVFEVFKSKLDNFEKFVKLAEQSMEDVRPNNMNREVLKVFVTNNKEPSLNISRKSRKSRNSKKSQRRRSKSRPRRKSKPHRTSKNYRKK